MDAFGFRRSPLYARSAAVATSHPLASGEALTILRQGGSAADAAIAAAAVLCMAEPQMTGIGGDCFALVKTPQQQTPLALNGSGWTPQQLTDNNGIADTITIPGAVAAWKKLHDRFGRLPFARLFDSAIRYADEGCPVAARVAEDWQLFGARVQKDNDAAKIFLPGGRAPAEGELFRNPELAATLAQIADDGGESFYRGGIAEQMVAKLRAVGGGHSPADFADYDAVWQKPVSGDYRGWRVWQCPPNGQGIVALLMLSAMMQTNDWQILSPPERAHRYAIITRLAYQWRDDNIGGEVDTAKLLSTMGRQGEVIAAAAKGGDIPPPCNPPPEHRDTVYLAVADGGGMTVSFINSIFHPFGSGIVAPKSGILLHNRGASFVSAAGHPNTLAPRKRPMHTIIPAIAESEKGVLTFGVMGGHYQAAGQAWFLHKWLDEGMDLQRAMDAPRLFNYPDKIYAEKGMDAAIIGELRRRGHLVEYSAQYIGGGQAVFCAASGVVAAASDSRKDGIAAGF